MKIKYFFTRIQENTCVKVANKGYYLQSFSGGTQGNIKRQDETVLIRYHMINDKIFIAFAKKDCPKEFDYEKYEIDLGADVIEVKNFLHENAAELYRVLAALENK